MPTIISAQGTKRPAPRWWRNLERGLLIALIPSLTLIIQSWGCPDEKLTLRINLIVNTGLVAIIKFIGMMLVDPDDNYVSNLPAEEKEKIADVNAKP